MKKFIPVLFIVFIALQIAKAQNLVPNPSFEEYSECPEYLTQIERAIHWNSYIGSVDYFNSCANASSITSVPDNTFGNQCPNSGNAYIGLYTYLLDTINIEFAFTKLINPLIIGRKYYVSYYFSLPDMVGCACNNISILFTNDTLETYTINFSHINSSIIYTDCNKWGKFSASFIADSSYNYIYIGNFYDNQNTDTLFLGTYFPPIITTGCENSYYYIDDICVSEDSLTCVDITKEIIDFNANTTTVKQDSCINYSINTVVNYDYFEWNFEGGNPTTSNLENPTVYYDSVGTFTTTLIAYNNNACGDTIIKQNYINVIISNNIYEFSDNFEFINNPYDNYIIIKPKTSENISNIKIYDILGKQIKTSINKTTGLIKITLNQNTKNGIYILKITDNKNRSFSKKIVKI